VRRLAALPELRGKLLVCYCHPARCHGDELATRANALPDEPPRTRFVPQTPDDHAREIYLLAETILECARPGGGFDYSLLRPYWRAVCELYGPLDARELAQWARATVANKEVTV